MIHRPARLFVLAGLLLLSACAAPPEDPAETPERPGWVLAVHGGAGSTPRDIDPAEADGYLEAIRLALQLGGETLEKGGTSVDAVERVIRFLEDDPRFNAGRGAVFTREGTHELDASIMNGATLECGAVTGVKNIRNPISLARLVMDESRHVFLAGAGAEAFAAEHGVETAPDDYFFHQERYDSWRKALEKDTFWEDEEADEKDEAQGTGGSGDRKKGTVGCVALDRHGNLAAGTSTGGITNKRFGRIGDSPVIGSGTYANDRTCAVSCTGHGETFIRYQVAHDVSALMEYGGLSLAAAADSVIMGKLAAGEGGLVALSRNGEVVFSFSTDSMFRGAADAAGRLEAAIWKD